MAKATLKRDVEVTLTMNELEAVTLRNLLARGTGSVPGLELFQALDDVLDDAEVDVDQVLVTDGTGAYLAWKAELT